MIGEKLGYVAVKAATKEDGKPSETLFDASDAVRKLDENQSYSQWLIAIAAMKGVEPSKLDMDAYGTLGKGLEAESRKLRMMGYEGIDIASIRPQGV